MTVLMAVVLLVVLVLSFCAGMIVQGEQPQRNSYTRVREFHEAFGHPHPDYPTTEARTSLRISLIDEEFREYKQAVASKDIVAIADALGDLDVVINGAAIEHGIYLPNVTKEIHRSNMTKLGADGKPIYREDGKVLKGPNYEPPRLKEILGV